MKRIGMFTGTVYDEDYDFSKCPECCAQISDEQAADEEFVSSHRAKTLSKCITCMGCPAAR